MAMTASLAVDDNTVQAASQECHVTLTVSNSGSVDVRVIGLRPYIQAPTGSTPRRIAATCGMPVLNANTSTVTAGSSATFSWTAYFHSPEAKGLAGSHYLGANNATTQTFAVGCNVDCADGTVIVPTVVTVTTREPPRS